MELKNIAILGPRGNVGGAVIKELLKHDGRFGIIGITRPASTYTPPEGSNIIHKTADHDNLESLIEAFKGQDAVVNCVTGCATQYDPSKRIIDAAIAAGVKFFFANEFVANIDCEQFRRLPEAAAGAKRRIRDYLIGLGEEGKIQWTSLNGGPFFDMWVMKGPAGFDIANRQARIYGTGNNPLCWTPLSSIALAVSNILLNPSPFSNRAIFVAPIPGLTQNSILATLEAFFDTKFTVTNVDVAKINKHAKIALERGEVMKAMKGLTVSNQFYEEDSRNDFSVLAENEALGVKSMTVEEAVKDAVDRWGADCPVVRGMFEVEACEI